MRERDCTGVGCVEQEIFTQIERQRLSIFVCVRAYTHARIWVDAYTYVQHATWLQEGG